MDDVADLTFELSSGTVAPAAGSQRRHRDHDTFDVLPLPRVQARLDGATGGVVLVSAPAGYGKSAQVALWAGGVDRPVAWLDLDATDNDPAALLTRFDTALRSHRPHGSNDVRGPFGPHPIQAVVAMTELTRSVGSPIVLVLDDVHRIDDPVALDLLAAAASTVPAGSTVVVIGHGTSQLPLGRVRLDGLVDEVTATDLALTVDEARVMFEQLSVEVDEPELTELVDVLDGWPLGLLFVARVLHPDAGTPIHPLSRDRQLVDFVHEQWLRSLDPHDMEFLLHISVLDHVTGPICDDIFGRSDCGDQLERLHRSQSFVMALDRQGTAYRLHRSLREILDAELERTDRARRRSIGEAAVRWFERHGDIDRAIDQALRLHDHDLVEAMIVRHAATLQTQGRYATVSRWIEQLPADRVRANPAICLIAVLTSVALGRESDAQAWLRAGLAVESGRGPRAVGTTGLELLTLKSLLSTGPIDDALADAMQARRLLPPGVWRAAACEAVGVSSAMIGHHEVAISALAEGAAEARVHGAVTLEAICTAQLAAIRADRGDWSEATALARHARRLARDHHLEDMPSLALVMAVSALVEAFQGEAAAARADSILTRRCLTFITTIASWANVESRLALARASLLVGDPASARGLLEEAASFLDALPEAVSCRTRLDEITQALDTARQAFPVGPWALTTAELRVLHLLPTHLSLGEIADRLYVSRNTAKSHAAAIYRKLGVTSRTDAVDVAREIGLLPS